MKKAQLFSRILKVDLTARECIYLPFPEQAFDCLGGRGFNVWYLYHYLPLKIDPLSLDNILLFSGGFLTGSSAASATRLHISALSPLTGILGSSNIGGYAGAWMRSCDLSSVIVTGKSDTPVYLFIDGKGAAIHKAGDLWGKDAFETQDLIKEKYQNKNIRILTIGPGGENRVRFACIMTGKDHAAGRTGMGAVMGSKNLKAIVIAKGDHRHFPADTPARKQAVKTYASSIRSAPEFKFFSKYGGAGYVEWANDMGIMAGKNYSRIGMDDAGKIDGKQLKKNVVRSSGCFRCPVQCKADLAMDPSKPDIISTRPEFEPFLNIGSKCGLEDINAIVHLDNLCSRLGIDSTSASSVIAFTMDLYEKGLLPEKFARDTPGNSLNFSWGNAETMEKLLYQIVEDRGLGSLLRLGVKKAAELLGNNTEKYAAHVKGLELTGYHPDTIMGTALGYAVSSRGGDYNNVYASLEYSWSKEEAKKEFGTEEAVDIKSIKAKGRLIKKAVIANILVDSIGLCKVPVFSLLRSFNFENEVRLVNDLTGLGVSTETLFQTGGKIAALEKLFDIRYGQGNIKDSLPDMFFTDSSDNNNDKNDGKIIGRHTGKLTRKDFHTMLTEYYLAMGWDENGIPPDPVE